MKKIVFLCLALFLAAQAQALAHSTKGRIKIPLTKEKLEIDDIAYFFESYVHREMYSDKYEKSKKRFYVNEFLEVRNQGNTALVRFRTLDFKEKKKFEDQVTIHRLDNGVWALKGRGKEALEIYTYVKKTGYYYQKYVVPISSAGLALGLAGFALLRFRKQTAARAAGSVPSSNT